MLNDPRERELSEARAELDSAVEVTLMRRLTRAEATDFQALENLVSRLAAKLGRERVRRTPYSPPHRTQSASGD